MEGNDEVAVTEQLDTQTTDDQKNNKGRLSLFRLLPVHYLFLLCTRFFLSISILSWLLDEFQGPINFLSTKQTDAFRVWLLFITVRLPWSGWQLRGIITTP